jgi:peptide deformylase
MLKDKFQNIEEFDLYIKEQLDRQVKGYLTYTERKQLKILSDKNYKPIFTKEEKPKLPIVTDINELKKPCQEVTKEDNISEIIQKLKDTLESRGGLGISVNQVEIKKRISYIKIPKFTKDKRIEFNEYILINAKIIEKDKPIKVKNEGCLSFPGVYVDTLRYVFCTVQFLNEKMEQQTGTFQDLESLVVQHECSHQEGKTIFDYKWRNK